jgi:hypothetical protein
MSTVAWRSIERFAIGSAKGEPFDETATDDLNVQEAVGAK